LAWSIAKYSSCIVNGRPSGLASVSRNRYSAGVRFGMLDSGFCRFGVVIVRAAL
jgi:hypothetical protein